MAVTKLNPDASPFYRRLHPGRRLPPAFMPGCTAAVDPLPSPLCRPNYSCAPLAIPAHVHPKYHYYHHYPWPRAPYLCQGRVPFPSPARPTPARYPRKAGPFSPHRCPPRQIFFHSGAAVGTEKLQVQAQAQARPAVVWRPCVLQQGKQYQAAGTRGRSKERRRQLAARSPSPPLTARPLFPVPAPAWLGRPSTVMIRNIPNRLTFAGMVELLDDHCARANKRRRHTVLSAYDFLYVPTDFSHCSAGRSSNMGYAFANFTTAAAARRLHDALHGCRWKGFNSTKVIEVCPARIQGKKALMGHFMGSTFACHTDEYLPAVFSPPRDGACSPAAEPWRVGYRVTPLDGN